MRTPPIESPTYLLNPSHPVDRGPLARLNASVASVATPLLIPPSTYRLFRPARLRSVYGYRGLTSAPVPYPVHRADREAAATLSLSTPPLTPSIGISRHQLYAHIVHRSPLPAMYLPASAAPPLPTVHKNLQSLFCPLHIPSWSTYCVLPPTPFSVGFMWRSREGCIRDNGPLFGRPGGFRCGVYAYILIFRVFSTHPASPAPYRPEYLPTPLLKALFILVISSLTGSGVSLY